MLKSFTILNFLLLLGLGGVIVFQWSKEKTYGAQLADLQKASDTQQNKILEQTEDLRRVNEDLEGFRNNVATLKTQNDELSVSSREQKAKLFTLEREKERLTTQVEGWQKTVDDYKGALEGRDKNIQTLLQQREQLVTSQNEVARKANETVVAYNELAAKYDSVVKQYNALATQYKAERDAAAAAESKTN